MQGLSTIAMIISVVCFPLACLALLYPHIIRPRGRLRGFSTYLLASLFTLIVAAMTSSEQKAALRDWEWEDWMVFVSLAVPIVAFLMRGRLRKTSGKNTLVSLRGKKKQEKDRRPNIVKKK